MKRIISILSICFFLNVIQNKPDVWNVIYNECGIDGLEVQEVVVDRIFDVHNVGDFEIESDEIFESYGLLEEEIGENVTKYSNDKITVFQRVYSKKKSIKIRVESQSEKLALDLLVKLEDLGEVEVVHKEKNIKYSIDNSCDDMMSLLSEELISRGYNVDSIQLKSGYELMVKKIGNIGADEREAHLILTSYGDRNYLIIGEEDIIIDF